MGSQSASHCTVCLNIFIEPVVLPCEHCLCKPCFDEILKKSNLQCPLCRKRIGSWARLQSRNGTLVNTEKWNYIQKNYPEEVKARLTGAETPKKTGASAMRTQVFVKLANTGEIRTEYENELRKLRREQDEENAASERLIKEILAKEERDQAAFRSANKENKPQSALDEVVNLPLTTRSSSIDSITAEFSRHFKPIVRYPRTPPRPDNTKAKPTYPETITPCPQTVKRLDFTSSCTPDALCSKNKDDSQLHRSPDTLFNVPSFSSYPIRAASAAGSDNKPTTSSASHHPHTSGKAPSTSCITSSGDHDFVLPLHSSVTLDDQLSSDGLSLVSPSTNTSLSNSRLRIATSSPRSAASGSRSVVISRQAGANSDTISYRSDVSSPQPSSKPSRHKKLKTTTANGHSTKQNGANKGKQLLKTNGLNNSKQTTAASNGDSNGRAGSVTSHTTTNTRATRSRATSSSSSHSTTTSRSTSVASRITDMDGDVTNGVKKNGTFSDTTSDTSMGSEMLDPDEVYARKLQNMYAMEDKYKLNSLRCAGSGNEYNTRKRKRTGKSSSSS